MPPRGGGGGGRSRVMVGRVAPAVPPRETSRNHRVAPVDELGKKAANLEAGGAGI